MHTLIGNRNTKLTGMLDLAQLEGLEIGPLTHPVVRKNEGKIFYADHASTEDLRSKYAGDASVVPDRMVELDYVTGGGSLVSAVGGRKFDYAIASHVVEHVPDLVGFLQDLSSVLRESGSIHLAIPDKRFTFDRLRAETSLGDLLEAHLRDFKLPSARQVFDHFANVRLVSARDAWRGALCEASLARPHTMSDAWQMAGIAHRGERYIDCHCHVFTPTSFCELLRGCLELELIDLEVTHFWSTCPDQNEFFVSLARREGGRWQKSGRRELLPPLEETAGRARYWQASEIPALLLGSRAGSFEGRIFVAVGEVRYWVTRVEWAREVGFRWPQDILWAADEDIAAYRFVAGPPPPPAMVRGECVHVGGAQA